MGKKLIGTSIDFFEGSISAEALERGNVYYESDVVFKIIRDKNYFDIEFEDGLKTNLTLNTKAAIKEAHCNCPMGTHEEACIHKVFALYEVRKIWNQEKYEASLKKKKVKPIRSQQILETIPHKELLAFVQSYASKNKGFAIEMKSRFARQFIKSSDPEAYEVFLNSILGAITMSTNTFSTSDLKYFMIAAVELCKQYEDAESLQEYKEASEIIKALFTKTAYAFAKSKPTEKLTMIFLKCHDFVDQLFYCPLPPELRDSFWDFGLNLLKSSYYTIIHHEKNLLQILSKHSMDKVQLEDLHSIINNKFNTTNISESDFQFILAYKLVQESADEDLKNQFFSLRSDAKRIIIQIFKSLKQYSTATTLVEGLKDETFGRSRYFELELLSLYKLQEDHERFIFQALSIFDKINETSFLMEAKNCSLKHWDDSLKIYFDGLTGQYSSEQIMSKKIRIYEATHDGHSLGKLIPSIQSLDVLMKIDHAVLPEYEDEVEKAYLRLIDDIFTNYVGLPVKKAVEGAITHLTNIGQRTMSQRLKKEVKEKYSYRKSLF